MGFWGRLIISIGIILIDSLLFFLPLTAIFLVYILITNPQWFRDFLAKSEQL